MTDTEHLAVDLHMPFSTYNKEQQSAPAVTALALQTTRYSSAAFMAADTSCAWPRIQGAQPLHQLDR